MCIAIELFDPCSFSNKKDILDYALTNRVPFREDKSNAQAKYDRNKIRNKIVPQLREINPAVLSTLHEKSEVFREASALLNESIQRKIDSWVQVDDGVEFMPVQELKNSNYQRLVLWEWLERGLFTSKQMEQILKLINAQKGKEVVGKAGRVIREQDSLSFTPVNDSIFEEKQFNNLDELLEFKDWQCEILGETALGNPEPSVAYFDLDKIQFPLHLRRWKPGDRFKPLGLKGSQKVKEFLTHQKIPSAKREDVLVLCSITENQTDICWLVGYRISDKYKVDNETQNVLKCDPKK